VKILAIAKDSGDRIPSWVVDQDGGECREILLQERPRQTMVHFAAEPESHNRKALV
jgi:hypothetical protein